MQPVACRDITFGNGNQASNTCFGGQQVIVIGIKFFRCYVITDMEILPLLVEQKLEVHRINPGLGLHRKIAITNEQGLHTQARGTQIIAQFLTPGMCCRYLFRRARIGSQCRLQ